MSTKPPYILWLPSWYPNKFEPFNGDFVQRHAKATSLFCPLVVCHLPQMGEQFAIRKSWTSIKEESGLKEIIHYINFKPTGLRIFDKVRYNMRYYKTAFKFLKSLFKEQGLPALVHVHVPMKAGIIARWIKKKYGIDFIVSEHSASYLAKAPDYFFRRSALHQKQVKNIFLEAVLVTNVSAAVGEILTKSFDIKKLLVVHNTVNTDFFHRGKKDELFTFIHVSTFSYQKNIEGILNVFKRYSTIRTDWRLKLVGPHTDEIIRLIKELNLEHRVELIGEVTYTEVAEHMKKAHVFVLFSRYENFPCVAIEALCCGLPVIASDIAGVREAVDNKNGILVESENEEHLLQAIIKVQLNYDLFNEEEISKQSISKYNYEIIGRQFFNVYQANKVMKA